MLVERHTGSKISLTAGKEAHMYKTFLLPKPRKKIKKMLEEGKNGILANEMMLNVVGIT